MFSVLMSHSWQALGYTTLMCGDGTNDVAALKHAHVGVALLSAKPKEQPEPKTVESLVRSRSYACQWICVLPPGMKSSKVIDDKSPVFQRTSSTFAARNLEL